MGIGSIPDAVLASLENHKNLGIHTEMFSDGLIPLIESGVVNNSALIEIAHPGHREELEKAALQRFKSMRF